MESSILGLRTVVYLVPDLMQAKDWYTKAFQTEPYFVEPFYVGFNIGGYELGLLPEKKPGQAKSENVVAYWGVNDINAEVERFKKNGAKIFEAPENVGGEIVVAALKDPWNNVIGLIYNPHFKLPD